MQEEEEEKAALASICRNLLFHRNLAVTEKNMRLLHKFFFSNIRMSQVEKENDELVEFDNSLLRIYLIYIYNFFLIVYIFECLQGTVIRKTDYY